MPASPKVYPTLPVGTRVKLKDQHGYYLDGRLGTVVSLEDAVHYHHEADIDGHTPYENDSWIYVLWDKPTDTTRDDYAEYCTIDKRFDGYNMTHLTVVSGPLPPVEETFTEQLKRVQQDGL